MGRGIATVARREAGFSLLNSRSRGFTIILFDVLRTKIRVGRLSAVSCELSRISMLGSVFGAKRTSMMVGVQLCAVLARLPKKNFPFVRVSDAHRDRPGRRKWGFPATSR